jgi:general secretion pathway protein K
MISFKYERGFILVAVLWLLATLAGFVIIFELYLRQTAPEIVGETDRLRAHAVELAGLELTVAQLLAPSIPTIPRPSIGRFSFRARDAQADVVFRAESGFVDLNFAPRDTLANLFSEFADSDDEARYLADRVIGWRTGLSEGALHDETALYRAAGRMDVPRRGPFQHVNELALVLGASPELVERLLPFVTVFSGQAEVNSLSAPSEVLAARPVATTQPGNVDRIAVDVRLANRRVFHAEAVVILFNDDSEPYRLLSWRD